MTAAEAHSQSLSADASERPAEAPAATGAPSIFRSGIEVVALNVVVTDRNQNFVNGLQPDDFAVFEDGVRQDVSYFAIDDVPLDLAILLDTSASVAGIMPMVREAAKGFLESLRSGDRAMVVGVSDTVTMLHPLGPDIVAAKKAVDRTRASGSTALYNALYITLKQLAPQSRTGPTAVRRQAVVVLSDGLDTSSLVSFDDVMEVAKASDIAVYTITLRRPPVQARSLQPRAVSRPLEESDHAMRALAQETGARAFFPSQIGELERVYDDIATELAHQYAMAYTPKSDGARGVYRRIMVHIADRPDVRARTRSGYAISRGVRGARLE
jgi:VWFA-related protein